MDSRTLVGIFLLVAAGATLVYFDSTGVGEDIMVGKMKEGAINVAELSKPTTFTLKVGETKLFQEFGSNLKWSTIDSVTLHQVDCAKKVVQLTPEADVYMPISLGVGELYSFPYGEKKPGYYLQFKSCTANTATFEAGKQSLLFEN